MASIRSRIAPSLWRRGKFLKPFLKLLAFERCPRLRLARPPLVPAFDQVKVANRAVVELPVRIGNFPVAGARGLSRRIVRLSLALDGTDKIIDLRFQLAAAEHRFGTRRALVLPCRLLCRLGAPLVLARSRLARVAPSGRSARARFLSVPPAIPSGSSSASRCARCRSATSRFS
jgi:hypothetical protein